MEVNVLAAPMPTWEGDAYRVRRTHLLREIDRGDQARTSRRFGVRRRFGLLVGTAALAITATAVAVGLDIVGRQNVVHEQDVTANPIGPKPATDSVVIASGASGWKLLAWKSDRGICLDIADSTRYASVCGFPVVGDAGADLSGSGPHELARFVSSAAGTTVVAGVAAADVVRVDAIHADGSSSATALVEAPQLLNTSLRFFVTTSSSAGSPIVALAGYSSTGRLLEQVRAGL